MFTKDIYAKWMYETQHAKYDGIFSSFGEMLAAVSGNILDVGSGEGWFIDRLRKHNTRARVFGIDVNGRAEVRGDGAFLPFHRGSFSMVACIDSIHLLSDAEELVRVLKPGGFLLVSIFVNKENMEQKRQTLRKSFGHLKLVGETVVGDKETDIAMLLKK